MCAAPAWEDWSGKHSGTGAGGTGQPALEAHGQTWSREKVISFVMWSFFYAFLHHLKICLDLTILPLHSDSQDSAGEAWPASVSPTFSTWSFHGDWLSREHDAAHPLPEEWSRETEAQSPHYRTTAWVLVSLHKHALRHQHSLSAIILSQRQINCDANLDARYSY